MLLSCMLRPYTVLSVTKSTVTIDKEGVAIPVRLDRVTMTHRVLDDAEPSARLPKTMGQPDSDMQ